MSEQDFVDAQDEGASLAMHWRLLYNRRPELRPGLEILRDYFAALAEGAAALTDDAELKEFMALNAELTHEAPPWTAAPEITARLRDFIAARRTPGS